jgi:hypothetical protein
MTFVIGEVETEQELKDKLELLCDKADYGNLVLYKVGNMYYACNTYMDYLITN